MRIASTTFFLSCVLVAGSCGASVAGQYLNRTDTITTSAGDAQDVNTAIQTIDPWPRNVGNRRIPANGERMSGAIQRYRSPPQLGGSSGTAGPQGRTGSAGRGNAARADPVFGSRYAARDASVLNSRDAVGLAFQQKRSAALRLAFWRDEDGIILPYVTVMLVVIIGVAVLAIDGARLMSLQTQLQNGADALALAGAAELDRLPDAETRAVNAMNGLLANSTVFGSGTSRNVQISHVEFYSRLPASDISPMAEGVRASEAINARFVSVTVVPVALNTILPASLFGGSNVVSAGASAVAGFDQAVCQFTPLFVCNPYEQPGMSYSAASAALVSALSQPAIRRRLIRLRQYGDSDVPYAAGDYGFLDAPTIATGQTGTMDALATARPAACFVQNGVTFRQGSLDNVREAFNTRFDLYQGTMAGRQNDVDYRPALNVRKGYAEQRRRRQ